LEQVWQRRDLPLQNRRGQSELLAEALFPLSLRAGVFAEVATTRGGKAAELGSYVARAPLSANGLDCFFGEPSRLMPHRDTLAAATRDNIRTKKMDHT
jgi:hypothetical protein